MQLTRVMTSCINDMKNCFIFTHGKYIYINPSLLYTRTLGNGENRRFCYFILCTLLAVYSLCVCNTGIKFLIRKS